jgi:hypothetical protein
MPTTLEEWYSWAFKLDWQYRQEQAKTRLPHLSAHTSSKYEKGLGSHMEKGRPVESHEPKAQPEAMVVTLPNHVSYASEAMDKVFTVPPPQSAQTLLRHSDCPRTPAQTIFG